MDDGINEKQRTLMIVYDVMEQNRLHDERTKKALQKLIGLKKKDIDDHDRLVSGWIAQQICSIFPEIDERCLAFCCSPSKRCIFRLITLDFLGMTEEQYITLKRAMGEYTQNYIKQEVKPKRE